VRSDHRRAEHRSRTAFGDDALHQGPSEPGAEGQREGEADAHEGRRVEGPLGHRLDELEVGRERPEAEGRVSIGEPDGGVTARARRVHRLLAGAWEVSLSEDIRYEQWKKLLWNVGFNAICAVTGCTAGEALGTRESDLLVRQAMMELVAVARRNDVPLSAADVDEMAAFNPRLSAYRPSTARDLDAGRAVEREAISGFVLREGARFDVDTPVNRVLDALLALQADRMAHGRRQPPPEEGR